MLKLSFPSPPLIGVICATTAFLVWGVSPIYWKFLKAIPAFEVLMHRMIWSFVLLLPIIIVLKRGRSLTQAAMSPRIILTLLLTSVIVGTNWFIFIWAINNDLILQTSLGYYINPLINVLLGTFFLKERLRWPQLAALLLAAGGVLRLTMSTGAIPWVSLFIAFSFGFYGLIRKVAAVAALEGLCLETFLLSIPATIYLIVLNSAGNGSFLHIHPKIDLLLIGSALVTGLPLLLFIEGARRIKLSTVGFLQYIAPSCTFLLAIFVYHEPITHAQIFTFVTIWSALAIYSADSLYYYRKHSH